MSTTTTTTYRKVKFDVNDEYELRKEVLDKERRRERKIAKGLKKKRKMERQEAINRELEELEYFFQFLCHTEIGKRDESFAECKLTLMATLGIGVFEAAKEAFNEELRKFELPIGDHALFVRGNYAMNKEKIHDRTFLMKKMQDKNIYTSLDRFLQHLFSFDDETINEKLLSWDTKGTDAFLSSIYTDEPEPMACLLKRDLREALLREWDERDYKTTLAPHVTMLTGVDDPTQAPTTVPHEAYKRVSAFESLENCFVRMKYYTRAGGDCHDAIPASSSSDAE